MKDIDPNLNTPSLTEQLSANFYNWEIWGRGWHVWEYPVELEPPFEHFYHRQTQDAQPLLDDGRKPGLFEKTIKHFKNSSQEESTDNDIDTLRKLIYVPCAVSGRK